MTRTSLAGLGVTLLLLTRAAHAEVGTVPPVTPVAPAPPAALAPPAPPAAFDEAPPPSDAGRLPPAFMDQFLSYDDATGVAVVGRARRPLTREELYLALDRPDLIEKSREAVRRRVILGVAGGVVLVAGVITAVIAKLNVPDLNSAFCYKSAPNRGSPNGTPNYNSICVPKAQALEAVAATGLIAGISLGGLLGSFAFMSGPDVLSKDEATTLISQHNGSLLRRMRGDRSEKGTVRVAPYASAQGGGLTTVITF